MEFIEEDIKIAIINIVNMIQDANVNMNIQSREMEDTRMTQMEFVEMKNAAS